MSRRLVLAWFALACLVLVPAPSLLAAPANDNLADAAPIAALPYAHTVSTTDATGEADELPSRCTPVAGHGVWYRFTPDATVTAKIDTAGSDFDTKLSVWMGAGHPLRELRCNNNATGVLTSEIVMNLRGGTTYFVKAEGSGTTAGNLVLNVSAQPDVAPPANDDLAGALPIGALPFAETMAIAGATEEPGEPAASCSGTYPTSAGVWFRYTAPTAGDVQIDTLGSGYNTILSVWTGTAHPLTELACNYDVAASSGINTSLVTMPVEAGRTYLVRVEGLLGAGGNLTLNARALNRPPNDDLAAAAPIDALPFSATVTTTDATAEPGEVGSSCGGESLHGVWYRFTPATTVTARVATTGSSYDTVLSVWIGTSHPLRHLYCNDDSGGTASALEMNFRAGTPYLIKVEGGGTSSGELTLAMTALPDVPRPAGDDLADAHVIGALPYSHTMSAAGGTDEPGELAASCTEPSAVSGGVWFTFTAPAEGMLRIDTLGSDYDTVLTIWTGTAHPLTEIGCTDDIDTASRLVASAIGVMVTPGEEYAIRVESWGAPGGSLTLNARWGVAPPNDDRANARVLDPLPFSETLYTDDATTEEGETGAGCGSAGGRGVWYRFTAGATTDIRIDTVGSTYDTVASVWVGRSYPLRQIACNDNAEGRASRIDLVGLAPGTSYYVKIEGNADAGGRLTIHVAPIMRPPNDDRSRAEVISTLPFSHTVSTTEATTEGSEPRSRCRPQAGHGVWYRFTPAGPFSASIDTAGSTYDTVLSVWTGDAALTEVACNDDAAGGGTTSALELTDAPGGTYLIRVEGVAESSGDLVLNMDWIGEPPVWPTATPVAPPSRAIYLPATWRGAQ